MAALWLALAGQDEAIDKLFASWGIAEPIETDDAARERDQDRPHPMAPRPRATRDRQEPGLVRLPCVPHTALQQRLFPSVA
jgi:hypothetical protein